MASQNNQYKKEACFYQRLGNGSNFFPQLDLDAHMVGLSGKSARESEYEAFVGQLSEGQLVALADMYNVDMKMFGYSATVGRRRRTAVDEEVEDKEMEERGVGSPSRGARSNRIWRVPELDQGGGKL